MSNPMLTEQMESSSKSSRREHKIRERKMWKKPIKISRLPSFGFSGSDQIPVIFSGYTAESEDSSSSEISDDSRAYSDDNEEIDQSKSKSVRRRMSLKKLKSFSSMKILRRQSTRKLSLGGQRLKKMRSMKQILRNKKKNLEEPHYLRPTSSSASKNVAFQKNLGVVRLKRISSLRYNGLLKATCSSAMKGSSSSKKSNDVCNYRYCSLHGRRHSHGEDNSVSVPSLKRFVSMRRKFLKRQKSVNRRLVLLKRSLSRKRGSLGGGGVVTDHDDDNADGESIQEEFQEEISISENDSDSNVRCNETVMVDVDDNVDGEMDDSDGKTNKEIVTGLDLDEGKLEETKSEETVEVCREDSSGEMQEEDGENVEDVQKESKPEIIDDSDRKVEPTKSEETVEDCREEDKKNTENVWNDTVNLVKQAFDEILAEITDNDSSDENIGADSSDSISLDMQPIEEIDKHLSVIVSTSHIGEESDHRIGPKKWSYLKRVILLKRFLKSLDRRDRPKLSGGEENETMRLRRELVGERKNAEEWMLDHALRQVISTLAPSQKKKVKHLVKAFESLIPLDGGDNGRGHDGLGSPETKVNETDSIKDTTDLEETKLTSEASTSLAIGMKSEEALEDSSSSHHLDGSDLEEEEKTGDSEKQNLSTWRNLIQKHMVMRNCDETDQTAGIKEDGDAAERRSSAVKSFQKAFETILSEIPDEEIVSESSNSVKEEKEDQGETKKGWNSLRKVILLKKFVKSLEKVKVFKPRKSRNLTVESELEVENVLLRSTMDRIRRTEGDEFMLDYALRLAISRLAPIQRKKVGLLVQAFDTVLDGHEAPKDETSEEGTPRVKEDCITNKDEQKIKTVFSRVQLHQKDLKDQEEVDSTPKESRNLLPPPPPLRNVKERIAGEKDSKLWKLIYKHMVTEKEETYSTSSKSVASLEDECDVQIDARRSSTVTFVREALEKILSEIPDNSSDDQSIDSEESITFKPKSTEKKVKGWNNVKKVILLKRFVSDLGNLTRLSPKTPRVLPWEPDPETEKIRLRHQEIGEKRNSEEWMLDYALRQAISTLAPSQKRKVSLLAQAFDTISLQDIGSCSSTPGSAVASRNISRQSSISSTTNEGNNAEIIRGRLRNLQEDLKETTKLDGVVNDLDEKQQCSSLWRLLCKQMEEHTDNNERNQTLPEEQDEEEEELKEDTNVDGEKMEIYQTEAVELLGEVIDGISQDQNLIIKGETKQKIETLEVSAVKINRWSSLKRVILLRRFVKALENVRKFNPREPRFLPLEPDVEAEKVNLRHQETQNKRNGGEWMVDNALQDVVSKLTPARKLKVQLLVQAFETLSATGN